MGERVEGVGEGRGRVRSARNKTTAKLDTQDEKCGEMVEVGG